MKAIKHDKNKPRLGLIPTEAILAAGRALTYGVDKYSDYNYKSGDGLDWNRYYDALLRHLFAWIGGEEKDKESGLSHLDHVMACSSMLADAVNSGIGKDTRFNTPVQYVRYEEVTIDMERPVNTAGNTCDFSHDIAVEVQHIREAKGEKFDAFVCSCRCGCNKGKTSSSYVCQDCLTNTENSAGRTLEKENNRLR